MADNTVWVIMGAGEVLVLCPSGLVTGDAAQRAVDTTTSQRTSIVSVVVLHGQALPFKLLNLATLHQWALLLTLAWVQVRWPALQALHHMDQVPMHSGLGLLSLVVHPASSARWVIHRAAFHLWVA